MKDSKEWVIVGRFGRPHGLKGYVSVYSFTEPRHNILSYSEWHISKGGHWTPLKVLDAEDHNRFIAVKIEGYSERETAAQLTNFEIAVQSKALPKLDSDEFYWHELIGMTVVNTQDVILGVVSEIIETGSNEVMVVTGDERYLIPFRFGVVVLAVCEDKRQITVDWDNEYL